MAELYRRRWQIELFFKWLKQNPKIKAFYGTSENAVLIQIWTALMAYLLILWIKLKSRLGCSVLEFTRFIQTRLMEPCSLWDIIKATGALSVPTGLVQFLSQPLSKNLAGHYWVNTRSFASLRMTK